MTPEITMLLVVTLGGPTQLVWIAYRGSALTARLIALGRRGGVIVGALVQTAAAPGALVAVFAVGISSTC